MNVFEFPRRCWPATRPRERAGGLFTTHTVHHASRLPPVKRPPEGQEGGKRKQEAATTD